MTRTLIIGGASGIGLAVAERFKRLGHRVCLCGRDFAKVVDAADRVCVDGIRGDIREGGSFLMKCAAEKLGGGIDIIVNAAALFDAHPHDVIRTNVDGAYYSIAEGVAAGARQVVLFSGGGVGGPAPGVNCPTLYAATKAAVVQMVECFAAAHPKVRINAVAPGPVATQLTGFVGGTPDAAVDLIAWLCSDAAAHVTGRLVSVRDGDYWKVPRGRDDGRLRRVMA